MLDFPRWKIVTILLVCAFFIFLALPNMVPEEKRGDLPEWMPARTVNLGLDLRGGAHLLLQVDFATYLKEYMELLENDVRAACRDDNLYCRPSARFDHIELTFRDKPEDFNVSSMVRGIDPDLKVLGEQEGRYSIGYDENGLKTLKDRLIEKSIEVVSRRVDETGTREPIIQQQGDDRILLQVPGLEDTQLLKDLLGKTAKMSFHLVDTSVGQQAIEAGRVPGGSLVVPGMETGPEGQTVKYAIKREQLLSGEQLMDAGQSRDEVGRPAVSFRFNPVGAKKFGEITTNNTGKPFAIVLDGEVITAPRINEPILGGSGIITGSFSPEEANQLAILLRSGSLPAELTIMEERTVGPSLGADSIAAGKLASLIAVALVIGFMIVGYGLFGFFSTVALMMNLVMLMALLSLFQATLTLPGIAGIVLVMGMAVDANVLIFERIREEIERGKTPFAAVDTGFRVAFRTILDSNITTLIAAVILFYLGSGTVKGFAVTLSIGILASMFSAIVLTRMMVVVWLKKKRPQALPI